MPSCPFSEVAPGSWHSRAAIAASLGLSFRTIKKRVENILRKLGVTNRTAVAAMAHEALARLTARA